MTAQDTIPETPRFDLDVIRTALRDPDIARFPDFAAEVERVLDELYSARTILAERQRDQWQPIDESTPHHQNVLVWREDAGEPWVAQYTDETFFDAEAGDSDRMDWFDLAGRYEGVEAPTHWQPLPAGPKGGEA